MPTAKDYFDEKKGQDLLLDALRKGKGGGKLPFAFGVGKSGALLAIDFRKEHSPEKFLTEIKKTEFKDKYIVGTASIDGTILNITTVHSKATIKPKEIKDFLSKVKTPVNRALIDGQGDEESGPTGATGPVAGATAQPTPREQMRVQLEVIERELDRMLAEAGSA